MLKRLAVLFAVLALVAAACASSGDGEETTTTAGDSATTTAPESGGDTGQGESGEGTLATVQARGTLKCGVSTSAPGFTDVNPDGSLSGFDVDFCKAIAAAALGDADAVEFRQLTAKERFAALESGEIDVLVRNTTWTQTRDTELAQDFVATTFYDGQQIMGNPANIPGLTAEGGFADIDGAVVCTNAGTTTEQNIKEGAELAGVTIQLQTVENFTEAMDGFIAGSCDIVTTDGSGLFGHRSSNIAAGTPGAEEWVIFPEAPISKEPLGPVVRQGDSTWFDVVQWTVFATFALEEFGISSDNAESMAGTAGEVGRLLGGDGEKQTAMGLSADAFLQVALQVGNYGEIYDRNLGPLNLSRDGTFNEQWFNGGLIYSPPFR